jgi:hypothetical protein
MSGGPRLLSASCSSPEYVSPNVPPKCLLAFTEVQGVVFQKTELLLCRSKSTDLLELLSVTAMLSVPIQWLF